MAITIEAIYQNGVLKLEQPLPLKEHERIQITIQRKISWVEKTYGLLGSTLDPETIRRIAEDPEFSILEAYDHEELERCVDEVRNRPAKPPEA